MKKLIASALCCVMLVGTLTACGDSKTPAASTPNGSGASSSAAAGDLVEIEAGALETPIILTSVGQSADMEIVATLCSKGGIDVYSKSLIMADELTDKYKTLILAVGGSTKGLGAAGIDSDEELARAEDLIAKAEELGMKVLVMHTGGSARRGTLSDKFVTPCFEKADAAIVVSEGDTDNFMRDVLVANSVPSAYVEQAADAMATLKDIFGV